MSRCLPQSQVHPVTGRIASLSTTTQMSESPPLLPYRTTHCSDTSSLVVKREKRERPTSKVTSLGLKQDPSSPCSDSSQELMSPSPKRTRKRTAPTAPKKVISKSTVRSRKASVKQGNLEQQQSNVNGTPLLQQQSSTNLSPSQVISLYDTTQHLSASLLTLFNAPVIALLLRTSGSTGVQVQANLRMLESSIHLLTPNPEQSGGMDINNSPKSSVMTSTHSKSHLEDSSKTGQTTIPSLQRSKTVRYLSDQPLLSLPANTNQNRSGVTQRLLQPYADVSSLQCSERDSFLDSPIPRHHRWLQDGSTIDLTSSDSTWPLSWYDPVAPGGL